MTCHVSEEVFLDVSLWTSALGDITYPARYRLNKLIKTGTAFSFSRKQRSSLSNRTKIRTIHWRVRDTHTSFRYGAKTSLCQCVSTFIIFLRIPPPLRSSNLTRARTFFPSFSGEVALRFKLPYFTLRTVRIRSCEKFNPIRIERKKNRFLTLSQRCVLNELSQSILRIYNKRYVRLKSIFPVKSCEKIKE